MIVHVWAEDDVPVGPVRASLEALKLDIQAKYVGEITYSLPARVGYGGAMRQGITVCVGENVLGMIYSLPLQ